MVEQSRVSRELSIPANACVEGCLDFPGPVVIDGTMLGDISCMSLVVGEKGIVEGSIKADNVTVLGEVTGEIFATQLTLRTASSVTADIFHKHLLLEDGCLFEGRSRRHPNPMQLGTSA